VGQVGNVDHENVTGGKAGRSRWRGKRPTVRGSAMNPVDHPHGGGEGKSKGGRHPVTPWGVPTLGKRTRRKHKESDKLIVRARRRGKERSEEHTSELQSRRELVCRLLLEKKNGDRLSSGRGGGGRARRGGGNRLLSQPRPKL